MKLLPWFVAAAGGMVWGAQFGRDAYVLAPWLALTPLFFLLAHPRAATLAFVHGMAFWLTSIYWIAPTLAVYGHLGGALAVVCLLLLAAYLSLFQVLFVRLGRALLSAPAPLAVLGLAGLWVATEWLRGHLFSGFPWNLAGYAWIEVPAALAAASWVGVYGLSGLAAIANGGLALAWVRRDFRIGATAVLGVLCFLVLAARFSRSDSPLAFEDLADLVGRPVRVIQPNIPNQIFYDPELSAANYRGLLDLSHQACDEPGALIVWPESAAWPYLYDAEPSFQRDIAALNASGCSVLFNSAHRDEEAVSATPAGETERWFNAGYLAATDGTLSRYDKRHLVPFGEYVPFARFVPFLKRLARSAGDFVGAEELHLLPWESETIGLAICFESLFPEEVAERVRAGSTLLATITNDAWYGDTSAPWQHFRAARMRAAETRRPVVRAAVTGVSAVVADDGRVLQQLGVGERGILRAALGGSTQLTLYTRWPWLSPSLAALLALFAILTRRFVRRADRTTETS